LTKIKPIQEHAALLIQNGYNRALVVSDLHLGWERSLVKKGIHIPSQTQKIRNKLIKLIKKQIKKELILLKTNIKKEYLKLKHEFKKDKKYGGFEYKLIF